MRRRNQVEWVPLTTRDMERFHENAAAALARRTPARLMEEAAEGLQLVALGAVPVAGLVFFDWEAGQMILFLLAGSWVGWVCDVVKLRFLRRAILEHAYRSYDDWHVWVVVEALRSGRREAPRQHLNASYQPGLGVFVDVLFGGIGTAVIAITLRQADAAFPLGWLEGAGFAWALGAFVAYQLALTTWEIFAGSRDPKSAGPVTIRVGLRGIGLFLLMFLVLVSVGENGENPEGVNTVMLVSNGLLILFGLLTLSGPLLLRGETRWLREYLERGETDA